MNEKIQPENAVPEAEYFATPFCEVALAIDVRDYDVIRESGIFEHPGKPREFVRKTPDNLYIIFYWDFVEWQGYTVDKLMHILEGIRHSFCKISEDGDIYSTYEISDEWGTDEEFCELLSISSEIFIWDEEDSLEHQMHADDKPIAQLASISDSELQRYLELEREGSISTRSVFFNEVLSDTDDEFAELISDYRAQDAKGKAVIDSVLLRVCGWTLPTLLKMAETPEVEGGAA